MVKQKFCGFIFGYPNGFLLLCVDSFYFQQSVHEFLCDIQFFFGISGFKINANPGSQCQAAGSKRLR